MAVLGLPADQGLLLPKGLGTKTRPELQHLGRHAVRFYNQLDNSSQLVCHRHTNCSSNKSRCLSEVVEADNSLARCFRMAITSYIACAMVYSGLTAAFVCR